MPTGFYTPQNKTPFGAPTLPVMAGGATQDRANIDSLLRGEFDPYEINMQSAERAVGSGTGGSGFAQAGRYKLLDSEKLARQRMGNEMLDPYLNREHQTSMQRESQAAQAKLAQQEAEWAMQRLQASEAGLAARLTQQEKAELEQIILRGNQAMELEKLGQEGTLKNTALGGVFSLARDGSRGGGSGGPSSRFNSEKYGGQSFRYTTDTMGNVTSGAKPPPDYWTPNSSGGDRNVNNLINDILRKYGFNNMRF